MAGMEEFEALILRLESYAKQVKAETGRLETTAEQLDDLDIDDTLEGLKEDVEAVQEEFNDSEGEAMEQVWDLTSEARELADERLEEAANDLGEIADRFEEKVQEGSGEVDTAQQELVSEGFEPAFSAIDGARQAYETDRQEVETAFGALREGVAESAARLDAAVKDMAAQVGEAVQAVTDAEKALEQEADTSAKAFNTKGKAFQDALDRLADEAETLYEEHVAQGVDSAVDQAAASVDNACQASGDWAGQAGEQLGGAAEQTAEAQTAHESEVETVETALANMGTLVAAFKPLSDDLRRCNDVVDVIDRLTQELKTS